MGSKSVKCDACGKHAKIKYFVTAPQEDFDELCDKFSGCDNEVIQVEFLFRTEVYIYRCHAHPLNEASLKIPGYTTSVVTSKRSFHHRSK